MTTAVRKAAIVLEVAHVPNGHVDRTITLRKDVRLPLTNEHSGASLEHLL